MLAHTHTHTHTMLSTSARRVVAHENYKTAGASGGNRYRS